MFKLAAAGGGHGGGCEEPRTPNISELTLLRESNDILAQQLAQVERE